MVGDLAMMDKDETIMQRAFLLALLKWAARAHRGKPIALPTGRVDPSKLVRVVTALKCSAAEMVRDRGRAGFGRVVNFS
jgi:hypothetical protein